MSGFRSFFINPNNIDNKYFFLDEIESHHLTNVLRLKTDDEIYLIDGVGTAYRAIIDIPGYLLNSGKGWSKRSGAN